jgi:hypothetical protein
MLASSQSYDSPTTHKREPSAALPQHRGHAASARPVDSIYTTENQFVNDADFIVIESVPVLLFVVRLALYTFAHFGTWIRIVSGFFSCIPMSVRCISPLMMLRKSRSGAGHLRNKQTVVCERARANGTRICEAPPHFFLKAHSRHYLYCQRLGSDIACMHRVVDVDMEHATLYSRLFSLGTIRSHRLPLPQERYSPPPSLRAQHVSYC